VEQRFGADGVRAMLRAGECPGTVRVASVAQDQQPALDRVAGLTGMLKTGERAGEVLARHEVEREQLGQRHGREMWM